VTLVSKLQLKDGQRVEGVLVPESVAPELTELTTEGEDHEETALLVFVADRSTLEERRTQIVEAATRDRLTWVSYPKAGQLGTDLNRDSLAALLSASGIQPVRQIALDAVWSALRFRPA
jgi:predicted DNA-binding antitoxin AbrB/MazE fold protein